MHTIRISIPMLKMNLSKTCPSVQERQRINKALLQATSRDAFKVALEQAITKVCRAMVAAGQAGWVNDPALKDAVLVQKDTGIRILSADFAPIRLMSLITHPPVAFPWGVYLTLLMTPEFEDFVNHMYLDSKGKVTVAFGHHITSEADALRIHNRLLPFAGKGKTGKATDAEVIAEFNKLKGLRTLMSNHVATAFKSVTSLEVLESDGQALMRDDVEVRINEIRSNPYKEFDGYPEGVQMAIADLAYNMGAPVFRASFPKFQRAALHRDWRTAQGESSRVDVHADRNKAVADSFDAAIVAEKYFITTDPTTVKNRLVFTTEAKLKPIKVP